MRLTQKMKKILIIALIVIAVSGVALLLPEYSAGKSYPRDTVTSAVNFGAAALGGVLEEHRTVSGSLRNVGLFARIGTWMRKLTGQATPADADEFLVRIGPDKVKITSRSRVGDVHELRIQPSPRTSKPSADLKSEILKILPGLKLKP